jgi:terminase large subunit-like protein
LSAASLLAPAAHPASGTLAADLAGALDPVVLARRAGGFEPDPWQADVLRSDADRVLLLCARQSGKSTIAAVVALHTALYSPRSLVLLVSPSQRQSSELFKKLIAAYGALDRPVDADAENRLSLELGNGSRVVTLPGSETTVRGFSGVRLIVIDEAARVPDDLYAALRPMLAVSSGRLVVLSTPFGNRGFFFESWRSGEKWQRVKVPASECPRISADFLDQERRTLGEWFYRQEYECDFLDAETAAFAVADVEAAFTKELVTWTL